MRIRQAVILAGGSGTRLRPLTTNIPKPMIEIRGKPFLGYLLKLLQKNNIGEVILLVGYLKEKIIDYVGNGSRWNLKVTYSSLSPEADTGMRLKHAAKLLDDYFLLLYGDNYWPLRAPELVAFYQRQGKEASVVVYANTDGYSRNNMLVENGVVTAYDRRRTRRGLNGVDIGFFVLNKSIIDLLPSGNTSFEDAVLPVLVKRRELSGFYTHHRYYGLSTMERISNIEAYFSPKRVIFLDRDGVINVKPLRAHYVTRWEDFRYRADTKLALKRLFNKGYWLFIVTNQPGVERGFMTKRDLSSINKSLLADLRMEGVYIKEIYTCMHGWDDGCFCRKPNPGLLYRAASDHAIELYDSFMIGDDERDIAAGRAAGCRTILIGSSSNSCGRGAKPDIIVPSLLAAVTAIERQQ